MSTLNLNQGLIRLITDISSLVTENQYPLHIKFYDKRWQKQSEIVIHRKVDIQLIRSNLFTRNRNTTDGTYTSEILSVTHTNESTSESQLMDILDL